MMTTKLNQEQIQAAIEAARDTTLKTLSSTPGKPSIETIKALGMLRAHIELNIRLLGE